MKIEDIKPLGNFEEILKKIRKKSDKVITICHKEKKYNSEVSRLIKLICGDFALIEELSDGIREKEGWNIEEMTIDLLYTHLIIIDLNDVAQLYLNVFKMAPRSKQLQEMVNDNKDIFGDLKIES